jgi:hypothetical protein
VRVIEWPEVLPTRYLALIGSLGIADNAAFSADPNDIEVMSLHDSLDFDCRS